MESNIGKPKVLVYQSKGAEDLIECLRAHDFKVMPADDSSVLNKLRAGGFDICILDHFNDEGHELMPLSYLRSIDDKTPAVMLTSRYEYNLKVKAFGAGADDYICRPYNLDELICRLRAVLKRTGIKIKNIESEYKLGSYVFRTEHGVLERNGEKRNLTTKERQLLSYLCAYKGELLPKSVLMRHIWSSDNFYNKRSLDVHISHLRTYLKDDESIEIETIRGSGYCLRIG